MSLEAISCIGIGILLELEVNCIIGVYELKIELEFKLKFEGID
jgi:hypothetical protein